MSKELIIVRHGKAVTPDPLMRDIDRVLAQRGINDGYAIGERLKKEGVSPDLILTSPAARANHTAFILARVLKVGTRKINILQKFYHCDKDVFLEKLYSLDDSINSVLISAHNPGITDLAYDLTQAKVNFLPTTGVALIRYNISSWSEVSNAVPESSLILKPREL